MAEVVDQLLVKDFDQQSIDLLKQYNGKALLLIFYNNQCLGCTGRAIPLAYEFQQQYPALQVIGIHANFNQERVTKADIKSIFTIPDLPFPIYIDEQHVLYDFFESEGTPQWILLTEKGEVFRSIFGSQLGAKNRLLYALEALMN